MIDHAPASTNQVRLPADEFYWAVLDDAAVAGRRGGMRTRLGYLFENVLPEPIEQVHAVYIRVGRSGNASYLACGMNADRLRKVIQKHPGVMRFGPSGLPAMIIDQLGESAFAVERINLLSHEFEPPAIRRQRMRLARLVIVVLLAISGMSILGLERRTRAMNAKAEETTRHRMVLIQDAIGSSEGHRQPPDVRLTAELRRLRQTRGAQNGTSRAPFTDQQVHDCVPILVDVLERWPSDLVMMTDSIVITPTSISIRGSTPGSETVQELADALDAMTESGTTSRSGGISGGWVLQQPQVNAGREGVQATIQLSRGGPRGGSS